MSNLALAWTAARLRVLRLLGRPSSAYRHFSTTTAIGADARPPSAHVGYIPIQLERDGEELCRCVLWFGADYAARRGYFALGPREAELVFLETPAPHRGRGYASQLLRQVRFDAAAYGLERLYARVWHSNAASNAAFRKASWNDHGLAIRPEKSRGLVLPPS